MANNANKRTLFICTHGIGDIIMMMPLILAIKKSGGELFFVTKDKVVFDVIKYFLGNHEYCALDRLEGNGLRRFLSLVTWIRSKKIDVSISQYGVSPPLYSLLTWLSGVRIRLGWKGNFSFLNTHSLSPEGGHKVIENARLFNIVSKELSGLDLYLEEFSHPASSISKIILGPGSGDLESHKRWPKEKFAELARLIALELSIPVFILGGPDEEELCGDIAKLSESVLVESVAGKLSIKESLDFMKGSSLVVSNCNGVSHLAASVGAFVVGLYGPTNHKLTGPFSNKFRPIETGLECAPCYRRGYISGCGNPVCMEDISVDTVFYEVKRVIRKINGTAIS